MQIHKIEIPLPFYCTRKQMRYVTPILAIACAVILASPTSAQETDIQKQIEIVKKVGPKGTGHEAAIAAIQKLSDSSGEYLPEMLAGMDGTNKLTANWLRAAIESVVDNSDKVNWEEVKTYLSDTSHSPYGRRLAYELLVKADPKLTATLLPKMLDDTSLEIRREAVEYFLKSAKSVEDYQKALEHARFVPQIETIIEKLDEKEIKVDIAKHLGFLPEWSLVGPFDNREKVGFDKVYKPENSVTLMETYESMTGDKIRWFKHKTDKEMGIVDLAELFKSKGENPKPYKGAIVYAFTEFVADKDMEVNVRLGCINGNKIWINGELVDSNHVYHSQMLVDQYVSTAKLKKGPNQILIKVCQNEQEEQWAQRWQFQFRLTDFTGKTIRPSKKTKASP